MKKKGAVAETAPSMSLFGIQLFVGPLIGPAFVSHQVFQLATDVFRWAVGGTATLVGPLTGALVFLGRDELGAQADKIQRPFFFQIERDDIFDASVGFRWRFADNGVVALNALVPLNNDGLRPDVIPTVEVEYAF